MAENIGAGIGFVLQFPDSTRMRVYLFELLDPTNPIHLCLRLMCALRGGKPRIVLPEETREGNVVPEGRIAVMSACSIGRSSSAIELSFSLPVLENKFVLTVQP